MDTIRTHVQCKWLWFWQSALWFLDRSKLLGLFKDGGKIYSTTSDTNNLWPWITMKDVCYWTKIQVHSGDRNN